MLGENGAGKSTLIKIIAGVVRPDAGEMRLDGRAGRLRHPPRPTAAGIVCVFQELSLIPDLIGRRQHLASPTRRAASA